MKRRFAELFHDEEKTMQLIVLLGCLGVSLSIGFTFADHIQVAGWQLWSWLVTVLVAAVVGLLYAGRPPVTWHETYLWLAGLVLTALLLRIFFLGTVPGGFHVDEVGTVDFTLRHVFPKPGETINPFRSGLASQPTLYNYLVNLSFGILGQSIASLRILSVLAGTLGVAATYWMVAVYQNRRAAILASAFMTFYHYHIHWSRIGLNNVWDTLWVPVMLAAFSWGWRREWAGGAVLAGVAVGLSQYFYAGSKIGLFLLVYVVYLLWRHGKILSTSNRRRYNRRLAIYVGQTILLAAIVAAPILFHAIRQPEIYFERSAKVFAYSPEVMRGVELLDYSWQQLVRSVGAFLTVPDGTGFYGPGVPLLIGLAAPLFAIGFFWSLYKRNFLPVLWLALSIFFGGVLLLDPPSSSHFVVVIPAVCWLMAMPLTYLVDRGFWRWAVTILIIIAVTDLIFYFGVYVPSDPRDLIHAFPPTP